MIKAWLLMAALALLLSGCSHVSKPDGPPRFYVDETRIPNAVPRRESLSRIGNKPYTVFGKRYNVMKSAKNFEEVGIASWYGTKFDSRMTSSGERYNMLGMTAAHRSLPLPTYVEVTNLKNQRKIIVKVNDRGPFNSNRIIDLSYVAAKKLGMIGHGTAKVRIRAIDVNSFGQSIRMAETRSYRAPVKSVYLQVGAFKNRYNAEKLRQRLAYMLKTTVNIISPSLTSSLYKVRIGPIEDMALAESLTARLNTLGINPDRMGTP